MELLSRTYLYEGMARQRLEHEALPPPPLFHKLGTLSGLKKKSNCLSVWSVYLSIYLSLSFEYDLCM